MGTLPRLVLTTMHRDLRTIPTGPDLGGLRGLSRVKLVDHQIGGVSVQTEAFRSALEREGHEVVLVTPFDGSFVAPALATGLGVALRVAPRWAEAWRLWWHDALLRSSLRRRRALLDGSSPTVVLAQCGRSAAAAQAYRHTSVPVVIVAH